MKEEFDIFMEEVLGELAEQLGEGFHAERKDTVKNNGVICRQVVISDGIHTAAPCFWMEPYYELYKEQADIRMIAGDIIKTYRKNVQVDLDMKWFMDWETVRDKMIFRLVGMQGNEGLFAEVLHRDIPQLGLSMVFCVTVDTGQGMGACIQVRASHLGIWGVTRDEVLKCAWRNTPMQMGACIQDMDEVLRIGQDGAEMPAGLLPFYVLSNEQKLYVAACILYDEILEQAARKFQSGFYVLPSSVHEVLLLPSERLDRRMLGKLKEMVYEINHSDVLQAEDVLIDEAYYYDVEHGLVAAGQSGLG